METKLSEWAKANSLPEVIELKPRRGLVETRLVLVGHCMDEVNYRVEAEHPYMLHGEEPDYQAIDFSEGPILHERDMVAGMEILYISADCTGKEILIVVQQPVLCT